jgi:hypothetical protein
MTHWEQERAADYRRQAAQCLEVATHMSLQDRRDSAMQMAKHFLLLAEEADGKAG